MSVQIFQLFRPQRRKRLQRRLRNIQHTINVHRQTISRRLIMSLSLIHRTRTMQRLSSMSTISRNLIILIITRTIPFQLIKIDRGSTTMKRNARTFNTIMITFLNHNRRQIRSLSQNLRRLSRFRRTLINPTRNTQVTMNIHIILQMFLRLTSISLTSRHKCILIILITKLNLNSNSLIRSQKMRLSRTRLTSITTRFIRTLNYPKQRSQTRMTPQSTMILLRSNTIFIKIRRTRQQLRSQQTLSHMRKRLLRRLLRFFHRKKFATTSQTRRMGSLLLLLRTLNHITRGHSSLISTFLRTIRINRHQMTTGRLIKRSPQRPKIRQNIRRLQLTSHRRRTLNNKNVNYLILLTRIRVFLRKVFLLTNHFRTFLRIARGTRSISSLSTIDQHKVNHTNTKKPPTEPTEVPRAPSLRNTSLSTDTPGNRDQ